MLYPVNVHVVMFAIEASSMLLAKKSTLMPSAASPLTIGEIWPLYRYTQMIEATAPGIA